ncbi:PD40 domain-containing protein [Hyphobacterium sp. CCMP332]|nr:PD40 domain-containing protein [Hyphobacterium sp. CCMP332]
MKSLITSLITLLLFSYSFADEALWLRYASISPDGKQIAFSYKGDIYKVSSSGGEAKQLTVHEAYDAYPIWSNDAQKIAFASKRFGNYDIYIMSSDGGKTTRLTYHSSNDYPGDFSKDNSKIIFTSARLDAQSSVLHPSGVLSEAYMVADSGGRVEQVITTPAEDIQFSPDGKKIIYHDRKGYENSFRKHHTSSVTRDILIYDLEAKKYQKVVDWMGEDRNPIWKNNEEIYFLSERSGSFNVWKSNISSGSENNSSQISRFEMHPLRYLSSSDEGTLCYTFDGALYTQKEGEEPKRIKVEVKQDERYNESIVKLIKGGAKDFAVSPNGKEIAFIVRGELFVTSVDYGNTKRITNTPEQERSPDFNEDGSKLVYAGERDGSWNIYEASLDRKEEKYFYNATIINEKVLIKTNKETFQPVFSPNGKEIAYLEDRTAIKVYNLESKESRLVHGGIHRYSYSDGDQYFAWSPDSEWLLIEYLSSNRWNYDIGLIKSSGKEAPINLTRSGYNNGRAKFGMKGEMVYWETDKNGYRSHGSWGSESDVYGIFLTEDAWQKFNLSKADYELWKEEKEDKKEDDKDDKKKKDKGKSDESSVNKLTIDMDGLYDRKKKLTIHSSFLSDFLVDQNGENLYYLTRFEKGYDLWKTDFKENETKLLTKMQAGYSALVFDNDEKNIFLNEKGKLSKISVSDGKKSGISFSSEMNLNKDAERAYMFEHAWRQFREKFYLKDLHGVDWDMYKKEYSKFLPHINNSIDFADILSEMLGEVNASHTGGRHFDNKPTGDKTASLGAFYDSDFKGKGLKIIEIMDKSPLITEKGLIKKGVIIEKINGELIKPGENYHIHFNRIENKKTLISFYNPNTKKRWEEVITPISLNKEYQLRYERWIKTREEAVDSLSNGRLGYVHVAGMNSSSFREVYEKALGKHHTKEALIVDTRFNGGGWLHDDLATFLSGKQYMKFEPRGQTNMGGEPLGKWYKPSIVLISESNYSDAHMFPYTYKALGIGKLIGMPVPGTGTAVWWEMMIDGKTIFGIPQVGMKGMDGQFLENSQLEPDIKVDNTPEMTAKGLDQQLIKAVEVLLEE